jgi:Phage tail tube protein
MAQRIAGIAYLVVNGEQVLVRGNFVVSPSIVERTMIAGQDGIHGYQELPRVPYIECDMSTPRNYYLDNLLEQTDSTVIAQLANGMQYTLTQAVCKGGFENNTRDGQVRVRWEGVTCEEVALAT